MKYVTTFYFIVRNAFISDFICAASKKLLKITERSVYAHILE